MRVAQHRHHLLLLPRHQTSTQQDKINTIRAHHQAKSLAAKEAGATASKHTQIEILEDTLLGIGNKICFLAAAQGLEGVSKITEARKYRETSKGMFKQQIHFEK
jgi:hypothetical protein